MAICLGTQSKAKQSNTPHRTSTRLFLISFKVTTTKLIETSIETFLETETRSSTITFVAGLAEDFPADLLRRLQPFEHPQPMLSDTIVPVLLSRIARSWVARS
jgi:hypothetical protein